MAEVEEKLEVYEVKREGEADILILKSNAVFFNPIQVHNRDMSIAVLRTFVAKRKEEHEGMINRKNKSHQHISQDILPRSDGDGTSSEQPASSSLDGEISGEHVKVHVSP